MNKEINTLPSFFLIIKSGLFLFIFMGINLFSFLGYSKDFLCELNERKLFRGSSKGHLFLFKPRKYQKGNFKINYKDTTLLMWTKTNLVNILLGSKKKGSL